MKKAALFFCIALLFGYISCSSEDREEAVQDIKQVFKGDAVIVFHNDTNQDFHVAVTDSAARPDEWKTVDASDYQSFSDIDRDSCYVWYKERTAGTDDWKHGVFEGLDYHTDITLSLDSSEHEYKIRKGR